MRNTVTIYGIGLAVALLAAYFSWTADSDTELESKDSVVVVKKKFEQLKSVIYSEDDLEVTLEPRKDDHGEFVWAHTQRTKSAAPSKPPASNAHDHDSDLDAGADSGHVEPEPAAKPVRETKTFKADSDGLNVLESMAPFRAIRKIEGGSKDRFESFGLESPRGTLTLNYVDGTSRKFEVGGEGYGHRNIYVRDMSDDSIYLVEANAVRPLRYADTRMAEKNFYSHSRGELTELVISDGTSRLEAEQKNRDDVQNRMWVPKGEKARNVPLETWILKFERVRGTGYATEAEAKLASNVLSVKLSTDKGASTTVDLMRGQTPEGDPAWYVSSEFTRGLITIPTAVGTDLANDFPTVVEAVQEGETAPSNGD